MSGMDKIKWGIGKGIVCECVCVWWRWWYNLKCGSESVPD